MSAFMLRYIFFSQEVLTYGQSMESIQRIRSKIWHSIQTVVRKNYESNAEALLFFYMGDSAGEITSAPRGFNRNSVYRISYTNSLTASERKR